MVPAWFAETFVIDHANAGSWRKQKDGLLVVDSLRLVVAALQDSILSLSRLPTRAPTTRGIERRAGATGTCQDVTSPSSESPGSGSDPPLGCSLP
jgi:hypothetical protein